MCSQYSLDLDLSALAEEFGISTYNKDGFLSLIKAKPGEAIHTFYPRYPAPVLLYREDHWNLKVMHFGLVPSFEKNEKPKMVFHNARLETVFEKVSFKNAIIHGRCLVPLSSFHEYVPGEPYGQNRPKRLSLAAKDSHKLLAAGIWQTWSSPKEEKIPTFSILTTTPHPFIEQQGHDRTPLFIPKNFEKEWCSPMKINEIKTLLDEIKSRQKIEFQVLN